MKISVLIHNLNRASVLERCLSSVAEQAYRPLEVVILDAGSTDNSLIVIERACQGMRCNDIEVIVVPCPQMGVAASRNFAARKASGNLLCFIDNDAAFVSSDCLCQAANLFTGSHRLALVSFKVLKADTDELDPKRGSSVVPARSGPAGNSRLSRSPRLAFALGQTPFGRRVDSGNTCGIPARRKTWAWRWLTRAGSYSIRQL